MKLVKVAAGVLNQTPLDWDGNETRIVGAIRAARAAGVSILCLPELCICGYGCEDEFHSPGLRRMARAVLRNILPETQGIIVSLGLPVLHNNGLFNTACLVADGRILGFTAKRHLAGEGLHYEPRWFKPWPEGVRAEIEIEGETYPIGDISYRIGPIKIGFEICEDAWVAARPGSSLSQHGVDIILNPSASHFAFGKLDVRKRFVLEGSRAFGVTYVYSNLIGNEAGRAIYDGGAMIASCGTMLAIGPRFGFEEFMVTSSLVDIDATRTSQARIGSFQPDLDRDANCVSAPFHYPDLGPAKQSLVVPQWETGDSLKEEEFTRAIALALFDYLRKSRSNGYVVSLSGGADSSATVCLVAAMIRMGCAALGIDAFKQRLSHIGLKATDEPGLVRELLTCIYQATENSSDTTRNAARQVAAAIHADYLEFDVDRLAKDYIAMVEKGLGRTLTWKTDDIALQNIQARVRGPGAWLVANVRNALLLATSNRSEAAVGYATMDGDTCGGLSPLAGIDKAFLRHWLRWMETRGPAGLGPLPVLQVVNGQVPTAELRPAASSQTDEADLMPYDVLETIEQLAIGEKRTPVECFQLLTVRYEQYTARQLGEWVARFFRLWCRNQWKRERYAPSFHVDDKNLDPRSWCRFPILSGGFRRELEELKTLLDKQLAP